MDSPTVIEVLEGLPAALKVTRAVRNASQRQVSRETGLSNATVSRIEDGEDCALSSAVAVLRWIAGVKPDPLSLKFGAEDA